MRNPYKAVLFDLDGTLFDHPHAEAKALVQLFNSEFKIPNLDENQFLSAWRLNVEQYHPLYCHGKITLQEQRILRVKGTWSLAGELISDARAAQIFAQFLIIYQSHWRPYPESLECLNQLKTLKLGIISNGNGEQQRKKIAHCQFTTLFQTILISEEAGFSKPAPEIFHQACKQLGVAPAEAVYVGDRIDLDIIGAKQAGLHAIWINRYQTQEKLPYDDVPILESLSKLSMLIFNALL